MRLRLPDTVFLPDTPTIAHGHLCRALGVSRQVIYAWRAAHAFPGPYRTTGHRPRDGGGQLWFVTSAVQDWLLGRGVTVGVQQRSDAP